MSLVRAQLQLERKGGTARALLLKNSAIKCDFSVYESSASVTAKPGVTLQPCCAHIARSSISGTQLQNGIQMFCCVVFCKASVVKLRAVVVAPATFSEQRRWCTEAFSIDEVMVWFITQRL